MPPVMGAAAFIMAEFLEVSYAKVAIAAIIPAIFYYFILFVQVDLHAVKNGFIGLPPSELPRLRATLKKSWLFVLPITALIIFLFFLRLGPAVSGVYTGFIMLLVGMFKKESRITFKEFLGILEKTGGVLLDIGIICCSAGFIIGMVSLTGLGFILSSVLISMAGGNLFMLLVFSAMASIILGMGMPAVACYIILVILTVPALIQMGVDPMAAHLFIFYFGIMSFITPPVCLAVYTASAIAGSNVMRTGVESVKLGIAGYLVPFVFVFNPSLLLISSERSIFWGVAFTLLGSSLVVVGIEGFLFRKLNAVTRLCFILGGLGFLYIAC